MKWITRERPKIDRAACPWLISRFIDAESEFIFVPSTMVKEKGVELRAVPYDVEGVELTHDGLFCSFDAFLKKYRLMKGSFLLRWFFLLLTFSNVKAEQPRGVMNDIPLPGVEGRIDHAAFDTTTHRLFIAALGNDTVEVIDLETRKRIHTIRGLSEPQGVLFLAHEQLLLVTNGGDGTCRFYDATSYAERGRVSNLSDADNVRFDEKSGNVCVGYGEGALAFVDPSTMKVKKSIPIPGHPESFQLERNGSRIFVNVPNAEQIAVADRNTGNIIAMWPIEDIGANFPMALDEVHHRLFVGCRKPARLLVQDTETGRRISESPLSQDVDDLFFDASTNVLMASCGQGFIDLFRVDSASRLTRTSHIQTAPGARTGMYIQAHTCFAVAVPRRGSEEAKIILYSLPKSQ